MGGLAVLCPCQKGFMLVRVWKAGWGGHGDSEDEGEGLTIGNDWCEV